MPDRRDAFIPARKQEIIAALSAHAGLPPQEAEHLPRLARLLDAILHFEAHEQMERLRELYAPLEPEQPRGAPDAAAFAAAFEAALAKANFEELDPESAVSRRAARKLTGLALKTSNAGMRSVRFFARGDSAVRLRRKTLLGLRTKEVETPSYAEVIVLVAFKTEEEASRADSRALGGVLAGARPGATIIKHFRNVAQAELLSLHPGAKPTMHARDQVFLAGPAIAGGIPIATQIAPAIAVIFTVLAAYFGTRAAIDNSALQRALAALSGLIAVGAFVMRQWMKYERQTLKYQKQLSDTVYFRNVANNAGVIDSLIGAGEDQDSKEAILAYALLRASAAPMNQAALDRAVEAFLQDRLSLDLNFEIGDALGKLERLRLVERDGDALHAAPLDAALQRLDETWDGFFPYARPTAAR